MKEQESYFYNPFDYLAVDKRNIETLSKMNSLVHYARSNSHFYKTRLPLHKLNSLSELVGIPILTGQDLRENLPPHNQGFITQPLSDAYVFTSGGTTGDPKFTFYSNEELKNQAQLCSKGLFLPGIRSGSRVANMMNAGNLWASFTFVNKALELCGCLILPIAAQTGPEATVTFIRLFNVNAAVGIPSFFISLADYCEEHKITDVKIEIVATGGEQIYPDTKAYISKILGVKKFVSAGYSSNDTGLIGFNCEKLEGSIHHIHEDSVHIEIVNPDTGEPVEDGNPGKILVTCLNRYFMPLIRYDIGDMGRILNDTCDCGRQLKLLELQGRSDDTLIISGYNITPQVISSLISHFGEFSYHFQIVAEQKLGKDLLQVNIETKHEMEGKDREELAKHFLSYLLAEEKALHFLVDTRGTNMPVISVANPETLTRNPKTGKIKQVIDKRKV
nr:phenylacetate--CoA ligase family protein [Bacteroidota bacterium]